MMKKVSDGSDIQEWEFIPVDDYGDLHEGKVLVPNVVLDFKYIPSPVCSSDNVTKGIDQLVPIPIQLEKNDPDEIINVPVLDIKVPKLISPALLEEKSQENHQLVDIKMDLIKSDDDRGINPEAEVVTVTKDDMEHKTTCSVAVAEHQETGNQKKKNYLDQNIRKWRRKVNGIGAICSIGVAAAATVCIFIFGSRRGEDNKSYRSSNQQFRFQIYTDDKRIKQVVHHATRLNQAISAVVSGVPGNRACITLGGYYDASFEVTPDFIH